jgi:hypothetical protein
MSANMFVDEDRGAKDAKSDGSIIILREEVVGTFRVGMVNAFEQTAKRSM